MCTAVFSKNKLPLFGRNLDLEYHYSESVVIVPQKFPFRFGKLPENHDHFSIIGTAFVQSGYPLFYDGMNEKGLCAAALNFPKSAVYLPEREGFYNVASFEIIPFVLSSCSDISEAKELLLRTNVTDFAFSKELFPTPLHWIFSDKTGSIAAEPTGKGLEIYDNPANVLANEPPLPAHLENLREDFAFKSRIFENLSSEERFVKAFFAKEKADFFGDPISQFFQILSSVGKISLEKGSQKTVYSCCFNMEKLVYYYRTYENSRTNAVHLSKKFPGNKLFSYPLNFENDIFYQN